MQFNFKNKTILITGGTRGIGKKIASDLSSLGANLLITGTDADEIKMLNKEAIDSNLKKRFYCVDLRDRISLNIFLEDLRNVSHIHGLVNNAGINRLNSIGDVLQEDWDDMISVNLSAPFKIIQAISNKMISQKYGRIINIASIFSIISKERRSVYSSSKFGLNGLTVGVSNDLARFNVLVNSVSPGFIMTDLTKKNLTEKEIKALEEIVPAKRLGKVEDISNVVVFLLSDLNQYLTGQNIFVDGGFTNV